MIRRTVYQLCPDIFLLFFRAFPFQERREEKQLQDKEHDEELYQDNRPQRAPDGHRTKTIPIELPNLNNMPFNHKLVRLYCNDIRERVIERVFTVFPKEKTNSTKANSIPPNKSKYKIRNRQTYHVNLCTRGCLGAA